MLRKNKIKIVGGFLLLGGLVSLFSWHFGKWQNANKKIELNLQQDFISDSEAVSVEKNIDTQNGDQKTTQDQNAVSNNTANNSVANNNDKNSIKKNETAGNTIANLAIVNRLVNWGFQKSGVRKIDTLIIHSSYDASGNNPYDVSGLIAEYKTYGVSPHYLIDRDGKIYQLVADQNIAYQAGESQMPDGRTNVNNFSLGVEMVETKRDSPTQKQYDSLNELIVYLKEKYPISNILGHNQIAPGRKDDPWNFDWSKIKK